MNRKQEKERGAAQGQEERGPGPWEWHAGREFRNDQLRGQRWVSAQFGMLLGLNLHAAPRQSQGFHPKPLNSTRLFSHHEVNNTTAKDFVGLNVVQLL